MRGSRFQYPELRFCWSEFAVSEQIRTRAEAHPFSSAAIMTGPEGGLTEQEVQISRDAGMQVCSLGPRILRCETAPLCALSALLYAADELA